MTHTTNTTDPRTANGVAAQAHKYNQKRGMVYYNVDAGDPLTLAAETIFWHAIDARTLRREVALYRDHADAAADIVAAAQKAYEATKRATAIARAELCEAKNFLASVRQD